MSAPYNIIINQEAGTSLKHGCDTIQSVLTDNLDIHTLRTVPAVQLRESISDLIQDERPLLIGGGDGTIISAVNTLREHEKPCGILPLGTMNLLAQDLGIPRDYKHASRLYAKGADTTMIDTAYVNDQPFLCSAAIGMIPKSAEFREEQRETNTIVMYSKLGLFILEHMDTKNQQRFNVSLDSIKTRIKSSTLVISNNKYKSASSNLERSSLTEGKLALYSAAPKTLYEKLRILVHIRAGGWKDDPRIKEWTASAITLDTKNQSKILVSLDGETMTLNTPLHFQIKQRNQKFLIPKHAQDKS